MNGKNTTNKEKDTKKQLHVRISQSIYDDIEELADIYGSKSNVIEKAVHFFKSYKKNWDEEQKVWNKARELNMVLVGKTTFMSYLTGNSQKAWEENLATEVIEWISNKHIEDLSLIEMLQAIKKMWVAANYFTSIKINESDVDGAIEVFFYHTFNKSYSDFWAKYFKTWLKQNNKVEVTLNSRIESFSLNIKLK